MQWMEIIHWANHGRINLNKEQKIKKKHFELIKNYLENYIKLKEEQLGFEMKKIKFLNPNFDI